MCVCVCVCVCVLEKEEEDSPSLRNALRYQYKVWFGFFF